ncbi:hypothetical protein LNTAR_08484 [Lentisphaera araneosa HTCC2155]|uniref:sn-glycerol-3-phosphate transport system permease protein UgpE n=1 Tax=Lentisphaera araneosa HTCC2155 TaxID=313628 RepID=A6DHT8_9BACT|nr:carbohydrate ABC transporter permease [Lentisphaera araneosa]EDM28592.1 hypothetical protein LNTAR_08484 [Lentisphaera araneosa HTCC2155]
MPILNEIAQKSSKGKGLLLMFYSCLSIGALVMLLPFVFMTSGAMKGQYNSGRFNLLPRYLYDDLELYRAWSESKYIRVDKYNSIAEVAISDFSELDKPIINDHAIIDYEVFLASQQRKVHERVLGHVTTSNQNLPENNLAFIQYLDEKFAGLENANRELELNMPNWQSLAGAVLQQRVFQRSFVKNESKLMDEFYAFANSANTLDFYYPGVHGQFRSRMILPFSSPDLSSLSELTGLKLNKLSEVHLGRKDGNAWFQQQRSSFIKDFVNARYLKLKDSDQQRTKFRDFLKENFKGELKAAQEIYGLIDNFDEISFVSSIPKEPAQAVLYSAYIEQVAAIKDLNLLGPDIAFQNFLEQKYGKLSALNDSWSTDYRSFAEIAMPQSSMDYQYVLTNKTRLRWDLGTINVRFIFNYLTTQGRAGWVTFVFCFLTIVSSLLINPLAAYALSRYQLPSTYKVLMFFMATMAFPAAVTQIPSFLLLKDLGMLNTFWALVLPGMANGYSIFILKGFFDSLPSELYEAAQIDGAGEFKMFWQLTLNLSKPVLALIALNSFTAAYGNFMYALLICQDESMWTIMVYLFKLQTEASQPVIFASLLVAAIPTLIIFMSCQKIIMKGIVIPSEK